MGFRERLATTKTGATTWRTAVLVHTACPIPAGLTGPAACSGVASNARATSFAARARCSALPCAIHASRATARPAGARPGGPSCGAARLTRAR
jgi:hypothetical protein